MLVIWDAKRADIGSTMRAYFRAAFDIIRADAMTVVPFFGDDLWNGFEQWTDRGLYVMYLPSSADGFAFQKEKAASTLQLLQRCSEIKRIGIVAGATILEQLVADSWTKFPILAPGLGAQGATIESMAKLTFLKPGDVFPISRGLTRSGVDSVSWLEWVAA